MKRLHIPAQSIRNVGIQKSKDLEPQHCNVCKIIDRACCSQDKADVQTKAHETVVKSVINNKSMLNKQMPGMVTSRSVSDDNGTCSTKTDEMFQNEKGEERIHVHQVKAGSTPVQLKVGSMDINARIKSGYRCLSTEWGRKSYCL